MRTMPRRVRVVFSAAVLAAACVATSCAGSNHNAAPATTVGKTNHSGGYCDGTTAGSQVVLYSTSGLDYWYNDVLTPFQANCRVRVVFQSDSSSKIEQQLEYDKDKPFADLVVATAPDLTKADRAGVLEPRGTPGSAGIPADRCGPSRNWCDVVENFVSFVYNPKLVGTPPATLEDLLAAKYAGKLLTSDLALADDGRSFLALLDVTLGRSAALRYITELERSVKSHWINTDTMSRLVAASQAFVANGNLREHLNDIPQYSNLAVWFPHIGVGRTTIAVPYG